MQKLAEMLSSQDIEKIFKHVHTGVALMERDGTLLSWNPAFEMIRNIFNSKFKLEELLPAEEKDRALAKISQGALHHWVGEFQIQGDEGSTLCNCMAIPMRDGRTTLIVESIESEFAVQEIIIKLSKQVKLFRIESDFTKKLAQNKQIEMEAVMAQASEVAHVDALTFLPNRRTIVRVLQDEVLRAERYQSMLSISIVDVDHFKVINDTYGHPIGDEVLRQVSHQLRDHIRHPDVVGRYGGEEFLIILPNSDAKAAVEQAERLCRKMRETVIHVKGHEIKVTLSIGTAPLRTEVDTWDSLLNRADNAMYEAKNRGRDCWAVAD
ncbi:MAG: GGDEF domain-containing protein [Anaerolineales bacterium]|jgi:diguanylate cyclase (GGDEF)-like protein|nr:GGDEF domain-containing protein [Anaerolineales bacterium]